MRKTILVSTSTIWNPGDDFIRDGVLSLIDNPENYNFIYWNRAKHVASQYDNDLDYNLKFIDYIIFAGTPQWLLVNEKIYEYAMKNNIHMSLIGVGNSNKHPDWGHLEDLLDRISKSELIDIATTRDRSAYDRLNEYGIKSDILPCPAGLCSRCNGPMIDKPKQYYCLSFTDINPYIVNGNNFIIYQYYDLCKWIVSYLLTNAKQEEIKVIAHSVIDIDIAKRLFPNIDILYSSNYRDYYTWYSNCKLFIGNRVHGSICALSHRSPAIFIGTDERSGTLAVYNELTPAIRTIDGNPSNLCNKLDEIKNQLSGMINNFIVYNQYSNLRELQFILTSKYGKVILKLNEILRS